MASRPVDVDVKQSIKDIFFSPNKYRLVDKYVIKDGKKHPFAVLVPGGGYYMVSSFIEGGPIAKMLNQLGISVFIVYYRVKKKALFPAPMDDLAQAVKEIMGRADMYNLDTENYSVWGASAGGHLAASFGTNNMGYPKYGLPKPGAIVLSYPVISMESPLTHRQSHDFLLGKNASSEQEAFTSVEKHVTTDYPPTYIWCGDKDAAVSPENTRRMAAALKEADVAVECSIFSDADHGIGPGTGTSAEGWIYKAVEFWRGNR